MTHWSLRLFVVESDPQTNKHLLLQTTFRAQRALPEVGAKGTAPSVTQRCWQSLADAAWNYPHTSNSPSKSGSLCASTAGWGPIGEPRPPP